MKKVKWIKAGQDNVSIISSSWCSNRSGICLSFAISIEVMSLDEIEQFGKQFVKAVNASYKDLLKNYFYAKTQTPVICSTDKGQIIMLWSFQGDDDKELKQLLKQNGIKEIQY